MLDISQDWRDLLKAPQLAFDLRKLLLCAVCLLLQLVGSELILYYTTFRAGTHLDEAGWRGIHLFQIHRLLDFVVEVWNMPGGERILVVILGMVYFWIFYVFSYFGAAVFRMSACEIGLGERISMAEARRFAREKFRSYFWVQGIILLAVLFFGLSVAGGGLLGRIPVVGPGLVAILFWIALGLGTCITLLLLGLMLGWDLMLATIAAEGTDPFDGISRGLNYVFVQPWRYLAYRIVGLGSSVLAFLCVLGVALAAYVVAIFCARFGMGDAFDKHLLNPALFVFHTCLSGSVPPELDRSLDLGGAVVSGSLFIFVSIVYWLIIAGYALSIRVHVGMTTYLLLRRAIDGTDMTEIHTAEEDRSFEFAADFEEEFAAVGRTGTEGA